MFLSSLVCCNKGMLYCFTAVSLSIIQSSRYNSLQEMIAFSFQVRSTNLNGERLSHGQPKISQNNRVKYLRTSIFSIQITRGAGELLIPTLPKILFCPYVRF